mgnify:CR=1 FL=1
MKNNDKKDKKNKKNKKGRIPETGYAFFMKQQAKLKL